MDTPRNQLVFADKRGLMAVDLTTRQLHCLVTEVDGIPLGLTDDVAVAQDGTVYLTDATRLGLGSEEVLTISALELLEGRGSGRLVKYDPATRTATVLMRNLLFANGVALSKNEDFLVVGDMGRAQILRLWLKGDRAGTRDVLIDNLVGMADGIWTDPEDGTFWVAVFAFRDGMSQLLSKTPFVAKILANLPGWMLLPAIVPSPYNLVLHYDASGRLVESLHGTGQHAMPVTSVSRFDNKLFLGTLIGNGIRVLQL
ncbi:strictosidine synthase, variant 3 [Capsaspora owczarzaki ATCC 30864]|nr:strictosidine synthase, variant 1 [Capsaspora owczarzaki ATCC 30864]KJE89144.1 strictosidine synthase, variant 2 [Capsaspora owczarzaki ATCC 30864]KJE89145.1 strictosidine synthase, variant 3 [Capsaspora owczarzaki ATCC 30864]